MARRTTPTRSSRRSRSTSRSSWPPFSAVATVSPVAKKKSLQKSADPRAAAVGEASPEDLSQLADALARAFEDDPALGFLLGEGGKLQRLREFFAVELHEVAFARGLVFTAGHVMGGALWAPPGEWRVPLATSAREALPMWRIFRRRLPLALWSRLRLERRHPRAPSYYLAALGVAPELQGRGLGGALLAPVLERADEEGVGAYLEASTPRSRALYERHGFEVTGEVRLPLGGPPVWPMWREPRA